MTYRSLEMYIHGQIYIIPCIDLHPYGLETYLPILIVTIFAAVIIDLIFPET